MELDEVDEGILYLLQQDARHLTTTEMAERVGVSASTVRNRIERLESEGVVRGYRPVIDYDEAGYQLHVLFICRAESAERDRFASEACTISGVVQTQEVLNGSDNLQVEAVGTDTDDIARISDGLSAIGLDVVNSKILKSTRVQPFDHFGEGIEGDNDE